MPDTDGEYERIGEDPLRDFFSEVEPSEDSEPPQEEAPEETEPPQEEEAPPEEVQSEILRQVQEYVRRGGKDVDGYIADLAQQLVKQPVIPESNPYSAEIETITEKLVNNSEAMRIALREGDSEAMRILTREAIDLQADLTRKVTSEKSFDDRANQTTRTTVRAQAVSGFSTFMQTNTGYQPNAAELEKFSGLIAALTPEDQPPGWVLTPAVQDIVYKAHAYEIMMSKRAKPKRAETTPAPTPRSASRPPAVSADIDIAFLTTGRAKK